MPKKYQREIEEILQQAGDIGTGDGPSRPPKQGFVSLIWNYFRQSIGGSALSITPGRVMLGAVFILLAALVLNVTTGSSLGGLLAWLGFILFIVGYAMFFIKPKQFEKRWRGDVIQYQGESLWSRIRKKLQ
jgi:protein-S-isoprenylcysteine O-methyltransferase Ste14